MTEAQMEKIAERAAELAVVKLRESLRAEVNAVLQSVATLDPELVDDAISGWFRREINHHISGAWVPQHYTHIERLTMAIGGTAEFKSQLAAAIRNVRFA